MKLKSLYYLLLPVVLLAGACTKKTLVDAPALTISLDNSHLSGDTYTYKLGDTVKFKLSGYAANVTLYTGDAGHNYDYRERFITGGKPQLSFTSAEQYGLQTNTLQLLAINKLTLDSAHIVSAAWKDITSRAILSTGSAVASGTIDLSDLVSSPADSLFIAFKYTGVTGTTQRTWTITNFTVNNILPDQTYPISNLTSDVAYWTRVKIAAAAGWATPTTTQLQVTGGAATAPNNISWIVSKPLYLGRVAPDVAVSLLNISSANTPGYNYKYASVGSYTATFVIFNNSVDEQKTVTKQFKINITN
ncbi:MAG: DUF5017 domain-containing protein [Bacteroidota bacterium]